MTDDEIEQHIRRPQGKRQDQRDPHCPDRVRRWSLYTAKDGTRHLIRFVFVVSAERTAADPGELVMITVVKERTP